jgi:hypothetical protein
MTAALDRAVANAMGLKSVNDCEKWKAMTRPTTAREWWLQERENQLDFAELHYNHFGNKSATMWMALFAWATPDIWRDPEPTLEDLMKQGLTRVLNGREMTLGRYPDHPHRIGWVWKDTGLPASLGDTP